MDDEKRRVSKRTHPDLNWSRKAKGFWVFDELIQSDAFRGLSGIEKDILLFILTRRKFNRRNGKDTYDFWEPLNANGITIPHVAVIDFFSKGKQPPPVGSTITRAIQKLMERGFLEPLTIGGNGKGNMTVYRLAHDWRVWHMGDSPVYTKAGMSRVKGFCFPGASVFCPVKNQKRGAS